MNISVIFATYKRPDILCKTLESFTALETGDLSWEVIVVDNAGDAKTEQTVKQFADRLPLKFIVETTPGKNPALNRGLKEACGSLFVFTDDDILADPMWLMEMWQGSKRWPDHALFGGRILPNFPSQGPVLPKTHWFYANAYTVADWKIAEGPYEARLVWGPNMAVRSDLFQSGWSFDPSVGPNGDNYVMGSETDFTTRLENGGIQAVYLPGCLVYHQIRPEQVTAQWLYGRAFRAGRAKARTEQLAAGSGLLAIPGDLLQKLIWIGLKRLLFYHNPSKALNLGIQYWSNRGMLYQLRKNSSKPPSE